MKRARMKPSLRLAIIIGAVALALIVAVAFSYYGYRQLSRTDGVSYYTTAPMSQSEIDVRKQRILDIYSSLGMSADYVLTDEDIFGEKRVYSWDQGRSYSSSREYIRQADVDNTVAELRPLIEKAGFSFVGEPYPGAIDAQFHFRSAKGEYVRLSVSSKPRDDAVRAAGPKGKIDYDKLPRREAPSNVLVKVNLDDNNE